MPLGALVPKFKRTGPPVDVPALGLVGVETGQEVEVTDPAVAKALTAQANAWKPVHNKPVAKQAAEKKSEDV